MDRNSQVHLFLRLKMKQQVWKVFQIKKLACKCKDLGEKKNIPGIFSHELFWLRVLNFNKNFSIKSNNIITSIAVMSTKSWFRQVQINHWFLSHTVFPFTWNFPYSFHSYCLPTKKHRRCTARSSNRFDTEGYRSMSAFNWLGRKAKQSSTWPLEPYPVNQLARVWAW